MAPTILGAIATLLLALISASTIVSLAMADPSKDRDECGQQLVGLATCLLYEGGDAKAPTPDCCSSLEQVMKSNKKCFCGVVRDRNDPKLRLNILGLPSVCHAPANVSQCPALLHMDPNSPEAQVFYQFGKISNNGASSPAPSPRDLIGLGSTPSALSPRGLIGPGVSSTASSPDLIGPGVGSTASASEKTTSIGCYTPKIMTLFSIICLKTC